MYSTQVQYSTIDTRIHVHIHDIYVVHVYIHECMYVCTYMTYVRTVVVVVVRSTSKL